MPGNNDKVQFRNHEALINRLNKQKNGKLKVNEKTNLYFDLESCLNL